MQPNTPLPFARTQAPVAAPPAASSSVLHVLSMLCRSGVDVALQAPPAFAVVAALHFAFWTCCQAELWVFCGADPASRTAALGMDDGWAPPVWFLPLFLFEPAMVSVAVGFVACLHRHVAGRYKRSFQHGAFVVIVGVCVVVQAPVLAAGGWPWALPHLLVLLITLCMTGVLVYDNWSVPLGFPLVLTSWWLTPAPPSLSRLLSRVSGTCAAGDHSTSPAGEGSGMPASLSDGADAQRGSGVRVYHVLFLFLSALCVCGMVGAVIQPHSLQHTHALVGLLSAHPSPQIAAAAPGSVLVSASSSRAAAVVLPTPVLARPVVVGNPQRKGPDSVPSGTDSVGGAVTPVVLNGPGYRPSAGDLFGLFHSPRHSHTHKGRATAARDDSVTDTVAGDAGAGVSSAAPARKSAPSVASNSIAAPEGTTSRPRPLFEEEADECAPASSFSARSRMLHELQGRSAPSPVSPPPAGPSYSAPLHVVHVVLSDCSAQHLLHADGSVNAVAMPHLAAVQSRGGSVTFSHVYPVDSSLLRARLGLLTGGALPTTSSAYSTKQGYVGPYVTSRFTSSGYTTALFNGPVRTSGVSVDNDTAIGLQRLRVSQNFSHIWEPTQGSTAPVHDGLLVDEAVKWMTATASTSPSTSMYVQWVAQSTGGRRPLPSSFTPPLTAGGARSGAGPGPDLDAAALRMRESRGRRGPPTTATATASPAPSPPPPHPLLAFLNAAAFVDECIAKLMDGLNKAGLLESTVFVFSGDRGTGLATTSASFSAPVPAPASVTDLPRSILTAREHSRTFLLLHDPLLSRFEEAGTAPTLLSDLLARSHAIQAPPLSTLSTGTASAPDRALSPNPACVCSRPSSTSDVLPTLSSLIPTTASTNSGLAVADAAASGLEGKHSGGVDLLFPGVESRVQYFTTASPTLALGLVDGPWSYVSVPSTGRSLLVRQGDLETDLAQDPASLERVSVYKELLRVWFSVTHCSFALHLRSAPPPTVCTSLVEQMGVASRQLAVASLPKLVPGPLFVTMGAELTGRFVPVALTHATTRISMRSEWIPFADPRTVGALWRVKSSDSISASLSLAQSSVAAAAETNSSAPPVAYSKQWSATPDWNAVWTRFVVSNMKIGKWEFILFQLGFGCPDQPHCELMRQEFVVRPVGRAGLSRKDRFSADTVPVSVGRAPRAGVGGVGTGGEGVSAGAGAGAAARGSRRHRAAVQDAADMESTAPAEGED